MSFPRPDPFLSIRVHNLDLDPSLSALCVGYERGEWRARQLADHVMDWLPEFALTATECAALGHQNATKLMRSAARRVYESKKFERRGEFGELLLHAAIRQTFDSLPAVSKIYYKSANNDTVKGFDAVHVVGTPDELELWLGEAKFYNDISRAISDVVAELEAHLGTDYLRDEFALIVNKIDQKWPHAEVLRKLLQPEVSLDEVFQRVCIPVLLTYDSPCISEHQSCDASYARSFEQEITKHYKTFSRCNLPKETRVHLFLLPLQKKAALVKILDERLKLWQQL
ncbi:MAG TPA: DUF1837 domain-containing protein [Rhodocyclaceae bacterium]|nr:DUF1837 domain-containing protein [Rhodocyclaceae bacterium]